MFLVSVGLVRPGISIYYIGKCAGSRSMILDNVSLVTIILLEMFMNAWVHDSCKERNV